MTATQAPTPGPLSAGTPAIRAAIALFRSAIKAGEAWSEDCAIAYRSALTELDELAVYQAPTAPVEASGSEREHGPKCWGKTSFSDEMMYCYCGSTDSPPGEMREAVLKGVGKVNGDGWKDTTTKGETVFVWNAEKPAPYAPGQYPRVGNEGWSASTLQYDFTPAAADDVPAILAALSTTPARAEAQDEGAAGEIVAWRETFIVEEEDGAAVGIVIDLPDGSQIWTGECSTQLLEDARAREESPEASGQYLIVAARDEPTRVIAQVATVDDGIALARAIAGHVSAHPSPTPAADADGVIRVLERICETQKRLYGNGTGLHLAMLDLCIDARAELSLYRAALKSTAAKEGGE